MTDPQAIQAIAGCIDLLDKYEAALLKIKNDPLCPKNLRDAAQKVLDYGAELVDD